MLTRFFFEGLRSAWDIARPAVGAFFITLFLYVVGILMGEFSFTALSHSARGSSSEELSQLEFSFFATLMFQFVSTGAIALWILDKRMNWPLIFLIVLPLLLIWIFRWSIVDYLDHCLFFTAWLTFWFLLVYRKRRQQLMKEKR